MDGCCDAWNFEECHFYSVYLARMEVCPWWFLLWFQLAVHSSVGSTVPFSKKTNGIYSRPVNSKWFRIQQKKWFRIQHKTKQKTLPKIQHTPKIEIRPRIYIFLPKRISPFGTNGTTILLSGVSLLKLRDDARLHTGYISHTRTNSHA